jgi:hypothetical protein
MSAACYQCLLMPTNANDSNGCNNPDNLCDRSDFARIPTKEGVKIGLKTDFDGEGPGVKTKATWRHFCDFFAKNGKVKIFGKRKFEGFLFFQKMKSGKFEKKSFWIFGSDVQCRKKSLNVCDDWRKSQNLNLVFWKKGVWGRRFGGHGRLERNCGEEKVVLVDVM